MYNVALHWIATSGTASKANMQEECEWERKKEGRGGGGGGGAREESGKNEERRRGKQERRNEGGGKRKWVRRKGSGVHVCALLSKYGKYGTVRICV